MFKVVLREDDKIIPDDTDIISIMKYWDQYNILLSAARTTMLKYENELLRRIDKNWSIS
jgi:hypothetical protein